MARLSVPLALLFLLAACARPGMLRLEDAIERVKSGDASPRERAFAGFAHYLLDNRAAEAAPLFLSASRDGDVWGAYGHAEMARRALDPRERLLANVRICELSPSHPLCAVAARALSSMAGDSPGMDAIIEGAAVRLLEKGLPGDAAWHLRLAAAAARRNRGDVTGARQLWKDAGLVDAATLLGPYSRAHFLEWDTAFTPELGDARGGSPGPLGPVMPRDVLPPDGRFSLGSEPTLADVYYWASEVEVREAGSYHLHAEGRGTFRVLLDGNIVIERRDFEAWLPEEQVVQVNLSAGHHRLVAKMARGTERGDAISLGLARADGRPANLAFSTARGTAPSAPPALELLRGSYPDAASMAVALEGEGGSVLASFVTGRALAERDPESALVLADAAIEDHPTAALRVLRAEVLLASHALPSRVARGRAQRELEEALRADPTDAWALRRLSILARGDGRFDEAADLLEKARAAAAPGSWRITLSEMHLAQARGADSLADELAQRALAAEPDQCDALGLRYELARRLDAVALADDLAARLARCPDGDGRTAEHLRVRGDLARARAAFERKAELNPLDPTPLQSAAQIALAQNRPLEAAAIYERLQQTWPRHPLFRKRRADALERAGDSKGARAEREGALLLDGSDLKLRRALAIEDGKEVLEDLAVDPRPIIARWNARHGAQKPTASAVYLLDATAVEAHPDGSFTERTHIVAKALSQEGVSALAEVRLPAGAEVLRLRTLKADGRVLEPEDLAGKEGISLPGVEIGDLVEYEYLSSTPSRGAALPGFAAPKFYFRIVDGQLFHSTYTVRAPAGTGLAVDAHHVEAPPVRTEGPWELVSVTREDVPTFVREPGGPSAEEILPWIQVGAGAGLEEQALSYGDFLIDRARPDASIVRFARKAAGGRPDLEAARRVWDRVMEEVKGPESPPSTRATATLAEGRGSRLMLLKSALDVLEIPSRVVLIRPFEADPAPYRFPTAELYSHAALRVSLPEGEVFLSPDVRFAPFGRLPAQAEGQDAIVVPHAGERPRRITTPGTRQSEPKKITLRLAVAEDGTLAGSGEEVYQGVEAAFLRAGLERMNAEQRRQALEAAIARTFDNGVLTRFAIDEGASSGSPVSIRFEFGAPGFARPEGGRVVVPRGIYPSNLARRFVQQSERTTPLLVTSPERQDFDVEVSLPAGFALEGAPRQVKLETPFGRFERVESAAPGKFGFKETLALPMARVPPERYRAFVEFLTAADQAERREVIFARGAE